VAHGPEISAARPKNGVYGADFGSRVKTLRMEDLIIAEGSPRQSRHVEQLIGSIRRECVDNLIGLRASGVLEMDRQTCVDSCTALMQDLMVQALRKTESGFRYVPPL
jgi:hypothetical protein